MLFLALAAARTRPLLSVPPLSLLSWGFTWGPSMHSFAMKHLHAGCEVVQVVQVVRLVRLVRLVRVAVAISRLCRVVDP
jgi:hypothetical protein